MIIDKIVIAAAVIISYFIQASVEFFKLGEIKPDFLLILTVFFGIFRGDFTGLWIGFFGGLLQDMNIGGLDVYEGGKAQYFLGIHALPKTIIGYITGKLAKGINKDSNFIIFIIILSLSLLKGFLIFFLVAIFHGNIAAKALFTIALPEAIYNAVIGIFWFRMLKWAIPHIDIEVKQF
ncbi:MAG: rod shape-determining protein MreD [Spirochaetia bacterium]|nr:rod shape-determining protein MreD [Spirochaetia bacterium]